MISYVGITDSNSALNSDRQLLVKPYLNRRMLLQELEDEIDGWQKDFASTASTSSVHDGFVWVRERPRNKATDLTWNISLSCPVFFCSGRVSGILQTI
jgi:hypothetical protein